MSILAILQKTVKLTFLGPRIIWRIIEMAGATAVVIPARTQLISTALKTPNIAALNEGVLMISEKIIGSWESIYSTAAVIGDASSDRLVGVLEGAPRKALRKFLSSRTPLSWCINGGSLLISYLKAGVLFLFQAGMFAGQLFLAGSNPLHARVTANAKRLQHL